VKGCMVILDLEILKVAQQSTLNVWIVLKVWNTDIKEKIPTKYLGKLKLYYQLYEDTDELLIKYWRNT
jgi:hypothetical protein